MDGGRTLDNNEGRGKMLYEKSGRKRGGKLSTIQISNRSKGYTKKRGRREGRFATLHGAKAEAIRKKERM